MKNLTTVTIGGVEYDCPELNLAGLEMAWPFIEEAIFASNPVQGPVAGINILLCLWMESENWDINHPRWDDAREKMKITAESSYKFTFDSLALYLKRKVAAKEVNQLRAAIQLILEDAEVVAKVGEDAPKPGEEAGAAPLTETVTTSLPSSSPLAAREVAGTA